MLSFHSGRRAIHNIAQLFLGGSIGLTATSGLQDELFEPLWVRKYILLAVERHSYRDNSTSVLKSLCYMYDVYASAMAKYF